MLNTLKNILTGSDPVSVLRALHKDGELVNLEPAIAALDMEIPEGYHHKNNLAHSFQVLQNAIDRETSGVDLILRTAALLHDIGKPETRAFGENSLVTFTNHETAGANLVRRILPAHGYNKKETQQIADLVFLHMRSHTFEAGWTESAVRRLITDANTSEQLARLIIIFYSDATTGIPAKKADLHNKVDALKEEVHRVEACDSRKALRPALNGNEIASLLKLAPGPELGRVMRYLNTDEIVKLGREETIELVLKKFGK